MKGRADGQLAAARVSTVRDLADDRGASHVRLARAAASRGIVPPAPHDARPTRDREVREIELFKPRPRQDLSVPIVHLRPEDRREMRRA